jgi:hypothetical protein
MAGITRDANVGWSQDNSCCICFVVILMSYFSGGRFYHEIGGLIAY